MWLALVALVAAAGLANSIALFRRARSNAAASPDPESRPKDPRALAWLRGGNPNLVLLSSYDLIRRGFLAVVEKNGKPTTKISRTDMVPDFDRLDPLETAILLAFEKPRTLANLLQEEKVVERAQGVGREVRGALVHAGLAIPREVNVRRGWTILGYALAVGLATLLADIYTIGADDVSAIAVALGTVAIGVIAAINVPLRLTNAGRNLLRESEHEQDRSRLKLLYQPTQDVDFVRLRATYGWNVSLGPNEGPVAKAFENMDYHVS